MNHRRITSASVAVLSVLLAGFSDADQDKAEQLAASTRDAFWNCLRDRVHSAVKAKIAPDDFGFFLQRACVSERDSFRSAAINYRRLEAPPEESVATTAAETDRVISEAQAAAVGALAQSRRH